MDELGRCRVVAFGGRRLNEREIKDLATELECLARVEAFKAYLPYSEFTVYTGHCALQWL